MSSIKKISKQLLQQKIDHFILPNSDEFFLEYLPESAKRIAYLTGFDGSNATIIIGKNKSQFFTDGRYILQAKQQLNLDEFEIFNIADKPLFLWLEDNLKKSQKIAIDAKLFSVNFVRTLKKIVEKKSATLLFLSKNPVDKIWKNKPCAESSKIFYHDLAYSGKDSIAKRDEIIEATESDVIIFTSAESICWLLNIRASDVEFSPLLATYAILYKNKKVDLFVDKKRLLANVKNKLRDINFIDPNLLESTMSRISTDYKTIQIDPSNTNFWLYNIISKKAKIIEKSDPALLLRACKNKTEIAGAIKAHEIDGLALTKFLFWIKQNQATDEISAAKKLLEFRKQDKNFIYPSFYSISSAAANGAVIHYKPSVQTNKKLQQNSLYLIDSGGQYSQGTTDVTRTIAIGKPSAAMIQDFTLVLKGHIALANAIFPYKTNGAQLDVLARQFLWQRGKDYDHSTGHGVGSFLSVHEGPCSISRRGSQELLAGMILSNEPGFYKENEYGIRIENLMLIENAKIKGFLAFKTLTLAPIDHNLIDIKILTKEEQIWLKNYHEKIFLTHEKHLLKPEKSWLAGIVNFYKNLA